MGFAAEPDPVFGVIAEALGFGPSSSSHPLGWSTVNMFAWRGYADHCAYETADEMVIVYHTGGASDIAVTAQDAPQKPRSSPGMMTIIPPRTFTSWRIHGNVHSYSIHLPTSHFDHLTAIGQQDLSRYLHLMCCVQDTTLTSLLNALATELHSPSQIGPLYAESMAASVAMHIARRAEQDVGAIRLPGVRQRTMRNILEKIEAHLGSELTLDDLAREADMSRAHFVKSFKQSTGQTPHQFLIRRRVERAATLMLNSNQGLAEIALRSGFSSQSHLTQLFSKIMNITPHQYRLLHR